MFVGFGHQPLGIILCIKMLVDYMHEAYFEQVIY
jgi:hypothetical protein